MKFTKQQFVDARKKLPPEVQAVLGSEDRFEVYQRILRDFDLTIDEARRVSDEASPVIYGLVSPDAFVKNLRVALPSLPPEKLENLIRRIDTELFSPIRSAVLKKMHDTHVDMSRKEPTSDEHLEHVAHTTQEQQNIPKKTADIAKEKMEGAFRLPQTQAGYKGVDPYREPTK